MERYQLVYDGTRSVDGCINWYLVDWPGSIEGGTGQYMMVLGQ